MVRLQASPVSAPLKLPLCFVKGCHRIVELDSPRFTVRTGVKLHNQNALLAINFRPLDIAEEDFRNEMFSVRRAGYTDSRCVLHDGCRISRNPKNDMSSKGDGSPVQIGGPATIDCSGFLS